jgi:hypothetical protein
MKKIITISLTVILIICCCNSKKTSTTDNCLDSNIDSIYVSYYNYNFYNEWNNIDYDYIKNAHRPTFSKELYGTQGNYHIDYKGIIDTVIIDCNMLTDIENVLKKSIRNDMFINTTEHDARMSVEIVYDDYHRDTLLFTDSYWLYSCKNEGFVNDDLGYFLRKNSGYYSWFPKEKPNNWYGDYFYELDTLNRRDSIKVWLENNPLIEE